MTGQTTTVSASAEVLALLYRAHSIAEVARITHLPDSAVRRRLARAGVPRRTARAAGRVRALREGR